jgi:ADP-dependent phosphofructokinase/glucokinase
MDELVNHINQEDIYEAEKIENDPQKILALIDLIFMYDDRVKIPS